MMRKSDFEGIESAPRWILLFLGAYMATQFLSAYLWNAAGNIFSIQGTPGSTPALPVGMAAADVCLCLMVLRSFPAGAPLWFAWLPMTLAAGARFAAGVMGLAGLGPVAGAAVGGPVQWALLAAGGFAGLRVMRRFGLWRPPGAADWAVCALAGLFTLCRFGEAAAAWFGGRGIGTADWISLAGLPILCVLFLEAMLLRQSVACMGKGLIGRGWVALAWAILLTGAGEAVLWAIPHFSQSASLAMFEQVIRLPMAAAFALVPAYQLAAQRRAVKPEKGQAVTLPAGIPALAR